MTADASNLPQRVRRHALRQLALGGLLLGLFTVAAQGSEVSLDRLFDRHGLAQAMALLSGLGQPDLQPDFVMRVLRLTLESVTIGALGMVLAVLLGVPLALLAARVPALVDAPRPSPWRERRRGMVRWLARSFLSSLRAIPEIVWAFLFVRVFGLGPGPAVFAIGLTFAGIIGKLYAERIDACDPQPLRVLEAAGASRLAILWHGVLPQVRSQWTGYGLFRLECAIRSAAVLGVVGAGGLGSEIELSIRYFQYDKLSTALLALLACVVSMEIASAKLRHWRFGTPAAMVLLAVAAAAGLVLLEVEWASLFSLEALHQCRAFLLGFLPPTTAPSFLLRALGQMLQTVAMAAFATVISALAALLLAPWASRVLTVTSFLVDPPRPPGFGRSLLARITLVVARGLLQLFRALPELVWALLFVVWVGPGPFAGALAIAAHSFGILGRLYGEVYEDGEAQHAEPPRVLEAAGSSRFATWLYAVFAASRAAVGCLHLVPLRGERPCHRHDRLRRSGRDRRRHPYRHQPVSHGRPRRPAGGAAAHGAAGGHGR